eukprot:scaffold2085_cov355-Chaetoceros_neogracile.AAC.1
MRDMRAEIRALALAVARLTAVKEEESIPSIAAPSIPASIHGIPFHQPLPETMSDDQSLASTTSDITSVSRQHHRRTTPPLPPTPTPPSSDD